MIEALTSFKLPVKPFVPKRLLEQWQRHRYKAEQARYKDMPLNEVFAQIYEQHTWHRDGSTARYRSGPGSEALVTRASEAFIVAYIMRHPKVNTLVDIGCDSAANVVA